MRNRVVKRSTEAWKLALVIALVSLFDAAPGGAQEVCREIETTAIDFVFSEEAIRVKEILLPHKNPYGQTIDLRASFTLNEDEVEKLLAGELFVKCQLTALKNGKPVGELAGEVRASLVIYPPSGSEGYLLPVPAGKYPLASGESGSQVEFTDETRAFLREYAEASLREKRPLRLRVEWVLTGANKKVNSLQLTCRLFTRQSSCFD